MIVETTVTLVIVFSALVVVHEFGHFILAKLCGIRVEEFALGFGPRLLHIATLGDTEYNLRAVPLGGFVKLTGMEPGQEDVPYGFNAQAIWKRALVIFSGPLFSFLFAVVTFVAIGFIWGYPGGATTNRVAMVNPETEAARMGLRTGDRVVTIDGIPIKTGRQMTDYIRKHPGTAVHLSVDRRGEMLKLTGVPKIYVQYLGVGWSFQQGNQPTAQEILDEKLASKLGIERNDKLLSINGDIITGGHSMVAIIKKTQAVPYGKVTLGLSRGDSSRVVETVPPVAWVRAGGVKFAFPGNYVVEVEQDSAFSDHLKLDDRLVSVNGAAVDTAEDLKKALSSTTGELRLEVRRVGKNVTLNVPQKPEGLEKAAVSVYESMGLLGFMPEPLRIKPGLFGSVKEGLGTTWLQATYLVKTLTSHRIKEEVGGPVMIAKVTSSSVARGVDTVVFMMGSLSLSLAVVNLVPLPILDGGHLFLLALEGLRRRRLTAVQMQAWQMAGLAILGVIVVLVLWSDIFKITKGLVPQ